jgi:argininosuccinate synthase
MIENRVVGIKSREIYEAPAAIALIEAHKALEDVVLTKSELRIKRGLETTWTELVYEGQWFSPAREAIDAFVAKTQERVTGEIRLSLQPNLAVVAGRRSENAIYSEELASYSTGETFPHGAAEGFLTLQALVVEIVAQLRRGGVPA